MAVTESPFRRKTEGMKGRPHWSARNLAWTAQLVISWNLTNVLLQ